MELCIARCFLSQISVVGQKISAGEWQTPSHSCWAIHRTKTLGQNKRIMKRKATMVAGYIGTLCSSGTSHLTQLKEDPGSLTMSSSNLCVGIS